MGINHKTATSAAPIGGLNVADSFVNMPPTDATSMQNFFTQPYGCELRKGYVRHATGLGGPVESLVEHITARESSGAKLFAFANGNMYDVTLPGDQTRVPVVSGLGNNRWYHIGIANASGYNVVAYNGVNDGIWIHDNHTVTRITAAINPSAPVAGEIAGVLPSNLIGGCMHQKRMWLVQKESTKAWYLDPEAITGQAYLFDFGAVFSRGGKLMTLASWTLDSGNGPDDILVAISSVGEMAIYQGINPANVATWQLQGVFYTGAPMGRRCAEAYAGDLLILTQFGLLSMNEAVKTGDPTSGQGNQYLSKKIQYLLSTLANDLPNEYGWQVVSWPDTNMIIVNVPLIGESGQLVQSTITQGWSQFTGMNAKSWVVAGRGLVFGDASGNVYRAWEGHTDGAIQSDSVTITEGEPIYGSAQTAFNYYGAATVVKHAKMVRPTFMNSATVAYVIQANPDFNFQVPLSNGAAAPVSSDSLWDSGLWDKAKWVGGTKTQKLWTSVTGVGSAFGIRIALESNQPVLWAAYDFIYEEGTGI